MPDAAKVATALVVWAPEKTAGDWRASEAADVPRLRGARQDGEREKGKREFEGAQELTLGDASLSIRL